MEKIATLKENWLKNEIDKLVESGKSKALIAQELGILPQQLNNILNGKGGISDKFLDKFIERFEINEIYLSSKRIQTNSDGTDQGCSKMKDMECQDFSLRTDKHIISQDIPLYNFDAAAGLVAIFNQYQIEPDNYIRIPNIPPVDGAIYVKGESMSPLIKNGDVVMFKKKEVNIDNILWGEIYILSFINDGDSYTAVKYLRQSDRPDYIRLESFNPDFPPKDIPMASITALAIVKASLTFHTME